MPTIPCPPEWITWLRESFIVPDCLTPHGEKDVLSEEAQSTSMRLFGPGDGAFAFLLLPVAHFVIDLPFQDDSCSTFAHDLLCVGGTDTYKA